MSCQSRCLIKQTAHSLTQLPSADREVSIQNDPLLNALSVGSGLLVDSFDALLDGSVDRRVSSARDLGDARGLAAQLPAQLHGFWRQLVLWIARVWVHLALEGEEKNQINIRNQNSTILKIPTV